MVFYLCLMIIYSRIGSCYQLSIDHNETNSTTVVLEVIKNNTKQCNSRAMTLKEVQSRLRQYPCVSMNNENNKRRDRRWLGGKIRNQINAPKGIINEHRNMINVLVNNSINAIYMLVQSKTIMKNQNQICQPGAI